MESSPSLYYDRVTDRPLRILEVGIGEDCRTILNGSYDAALQSFLSQYPNQNVELFGVDYIDMKSSSKTNAVVSKARTYLKEKYNIYEVDKIKFDVMQGDISILLLPSIPDGYFDVITCCLVLCSVSDQKTAIQEIKRLVRPNGGTFGYLEHVAVDKELDFDQKNGVSSLGLQLLEWEQLLFDPAQQLVAHNYHLHRSTEDLIWKEFGLEVNDTQILQKERFFVKDMWPVSCQTCGVVIKS